MKKNLWLFGALLMALLSSCSSNDSSSDSNTEVVLKPTKIVHLTPENSVIYVTDVKYDGNKIVSSTDDDGYVSKYTYTGDVITKIEEFEEFTVLKNTREYTYLNGKMSTMIERKPNEMKYFETKYTHNADGIISFDVRQINSTPGEVVASSGKYTYKNGNMVKWESLSDTVTLYEFDTKKSPFSGVLGMNLLINWVTASSNNRIKVTTNVSTAHQTTYSYLYNNNDFPIEQKRFGNEGNLEEIVQYTY